VTLLADGRYHFTVGSVEIGNGLVTAQQQVVAAILNCAATSVTFLNADTDKTPYDSGTFASVGMMVPTKAVELAAVALREKMLGFAARTMATVVNECRLEDGAVVCRDRRLPLVELHSVAREHGENLSCFRRAYGAPRTVAFMAYGVRLAVHRVTGEIRILFSVEAVDAGAVMNAHQLRGQAVGGVVQGIGYALQEKMVYNDAGAVINPTLRNYRIPAFADAPVTEVFFADTYDEIGPLGSKSISENTINPVPPAIGNALKAATGVRFTALPFSEDRIFEKLQNLEAAPRG
jgi:CO/xanthine dehydrogenase Mo-binding subunit